MKFFYELSPEEIRRGLEIYRDKTGSLFEKELSNPTGEAILVSIKPELLSLAIKWEECDGDFIMLKLISSADDDLEDIQIW